jgi:hypothetical protein
MKRASYFRVPVPRLFPRPMRPDELPDVRRVWWHWRRHEGLKLPPERGVILIRGGRS